MRSVNAFIHRIDQCGATGFFAKLVSSLALAGLSACLSAQGYPVKPVRFIVPLTPGAAQDIIARIYSERMAKTLGQPVLVEYKPGANAIIGSEYVARSAPDGYTLLMASEGVATNALLRKISYDPVKDFDPVAMIAVVNFALVVGPAVPVNNLADFLKLAKSKPKAVSYGSAGIASVHHLSAEYLQSVAGLDMVHVPYQGAQFVQGLLAGDIVASFSSIGSVLPQIRAGKLKAIGVASLQRSAFLPDVPTIAEQGIPGFRTDSWFGFLAPAGTPRAIVDRLNREFVTPLKDPEWVKERLSPQGIEPRPMGPEEMQAEIKTGMSKWEKVIKQANIVMN